jgi:hypothetical protein
MLAKELPPFQAEKRNFKKCPTALEAKKMRNKTNRKIKHERTTMAIRNSG